MRLLSNVVVLCTFAFIAAVRRSEIAFAIVTLVLMVVGNFFAAYSIRHVRYTYKRLTAGVHILTGKFRNLLLLPKLTQGLHFQRDLSCVPCLCFPIVTAAKIQAQLVTILLR